MPGEIQAFLTLSEGQDPEDLQVRGDGNAYVARFRDDRPLDLIKVDAKGAEIGQSETLQGEELQTPAGETLQVYYSEGAAILVHDERPHLLTAPEPFESVGDVREALQSGNFNLLAGFEPLPGNPVIELEPLLGDPVLELEPAVCGASTTPGPGYEEGACPGPPAHSVWVLPSHPFCPIHDLPVELVDPPPQP